METSPLYLPVQLLKPVNLTAGANLAGLFFPDRPSRPPMILADWEGASWALHLAGDHAFGFFQIKTDMSVEGVLLDDCKLTADLTSRYTTRIRTAAPGDLMLKDGQAFLLGLPAGGFFGEVAEFALWDSHPPGTAGVSAYFSRWKLIANDGEKIVDVWRHDGVPAES